MTNEQWDVCAAADACRRIPKSLLEGRDAPNHPVEQASFNDAQDYVSWLSQVTGHDYRLPSEAEWEYAARAGTTTEFHWGNNADDGCRYANVLDLTATEQHPNWRDLFFADCWDGYFRLAPVGTYEPNGFGLYDMIGNIEEWTQDCWNESYDGAPTDGSAWESGDCTLRVRRGGSWVTELLFNRSAHRMFDFAIGDIGRQGLRVARSL